MSLRKTKTAFQGAQDQANKFYLGFTAHDLADNPVYLGRAVEHFDALDNAQLADVLSKEAMVGAFARGGYAFG